MIWKMYGLDSKEGPQSSKMSQKLKSPSNLERSSEEAEKYTFSKRKVEL